MKLITAWKQESGDKYITLLDQAMLSFINFGSILALSRLTEIDVFGDFVVTYSYSVFLTLFTSLLLSSPILVFFTKKWRKAGKAYLLVLTSLTLILNLIISLLLFFFLNQQVEIVGFWPFFLLCFGISLFDVLKKFTFAVKGDLLRKALISTILLNLIFFGLLFWLRKKLELNSILLAYCLSFLTASIFLFSSIIKNKNFSLKLGTGFKFKLFKKICRTHYKYSKWLLIGGAAFWGYSQGIYILAKYYGVGDATIGMVRTIQNLLGVFSILTIAMESHYTSLFAENSFNFLSIKKQIKLVYRENYLKVIVLFLLSIPLGLIFYNFVFEDKYGKAYGVFFAFLFVQFLLVSTKPVAIALKSLEKTKIFFSGHVLAVLAVLIGFPLLFWLELDNIIVISYTIANSIYIFCLLTYYSQNYNRSNR